MTASSLRSSVFFLSVAEGGTILIMVGFLPQLSSPSKYPSMGISWCADPPKVTAGEGSLGALAGAGGSECSAEDCIPCSSAGTAGEASTSIAKDPFSNFEALFSSLGSSFTSFPSFASSFASPSRPVVWITRGAISGGGTTLCSDRAGCESEEAPRAGLYGSEGGEVVVVGVSAAKPYPVLFPRGSKVSGSKSSSLNFLGALLWRPLLVVSGSGRFTSRVGEAVPEGVLKTRVVGVLALSSNLLALIGGCLKKLLPLGLLASSFCWSQSGGGYWSIFFMGERETVSVSSSEATRSSRSSASSRSSENEVMGLIIGGGVRGALGEGLLAAGGVGAVG